MIIKSTSRLFSFAFLLLFLPLSVGFCTKRPESCHQSIRVVNNSDITIYIGETWSCLNSNGTIEVGIFDCCAPISPKDAAVIQVINRRCLEEYYNTPMSFYVLPESSSNIYTAQDSLYIVYNILKTIDLQALGVDSLMKTDYTVYYP